MEGARPNLIASGKCVSNFATSNSWQIHRKPCEGCEELELSCFLLCSLEVLVSSSPKSKVTSSEDSEDNEDKAEEDDECEEDVLELKPFEKDSTDPDVPEVLPDIAAEEREEGNGKSHPD